MKWEQLPELPRREMPLAARTELAKLEALRVIAETLERINAQLGLALGVLLAPKPAPAMSTQVLCELEAIADELELLRARDLPLDVLVFLKKLVSRARAAAGRDFP